MVMRGFKSFAKHTELAFGTNFNCVLGPNGSGKCLIGNSLVQLADGSLIRIDKLVNQKIEKNQTKKMDDGLMAYGDTTKLITLNLKTLKTEHKPIQAYIKRKSPDYLLKIRTRTGREVTSTEYHPLFILKDGMIKSAKAEELKEGIRVAIPREINPKINSKYFYELIELINAEDSIYVPYNPKFKEFLLKLKKTTWKSLSEDLSMPLNVIKGLLDKQAINFAYLVKILKLAQLTDKEIIDIIPHIKSKTSSIQYKLPWRNSPEFSRFLGYLIAEGRLAKSSNQIWFTNGSEEIIQDYANLTNSLFGVVPSVNEYKPCCWDVLIYSIPLMTILSKFGMAASTNSKTVKNLFLNSCSEEEIGSFLNGLYSGDGYVSKSSIELTTKSKDLALAVENMLLRLNITFTSHFEVKIATNTGFSGIYKTIRVYGSENFNKFYWKVNFVNNKKRERLKGLLNFKANPNLDLIEANSLVKSTANELNIKIKPTKKTFPKLGAYCYNQCLPSRQGINQLINELFIPSKGSEQSLQLLQLKSLANSSIFWDEIAEIERVKSKDEWVYDLCIEEHHNFIANNFFVHNSNVLDSLCFVLGKSSAKSMRAERSSNLIYNGGKSKKPAKEGEVSIYFDNSNKKFPTQDPEVKITRIVRQNGQSIYKINDKTRTRQEIVDLLSLAKIDPDGYNIILQGDITKFVEMHPIERRELIEEISGIALYEDKKHKALNQLEKVGERLKEAEIVLAERKTYLKELKKDHDQAKKFQDMSNKVSQSKASLLKIQIDKKEKEKSEFQQNLEKTKQELTKINEKISQFKQLNLDKKQEIESISKEIEEKGEIEQVTLNKEIETLKIDLTKKHSRTETLNSEIEKIGKRTGDLNSSLKENQEKIGELKVQEQELKTEKQGIEKQKQELEERISVFRDKNKLAELADVEKTIEEIDKKAEEQQKEIHTLREQQHNLLRQKDLLEHQINTIDDQVKKVEEIEKEHKQEIDSLKSKKQEFKKSTLELNKTLNEDSSLAVQTSNLRGKLSIAREELAKLQARHTSIKETTASNIAIKKVLENKGKGIYGTISELGQVNSKYSLALEIAAGHRLKSIVVDDEKIAAEQIKYLKKNKLGTATFIPLNKIKPKPTSEETQKLKKAKGCYGLAIDLINFDDKFKKVFQYVFSNTLVIDNIDVARRLGIGKARMVTLDGDLTEFSGVMHGGYRKKRPGLGFNEKEISTDIEKYQTEIENLENTSKTLEKRRAENEDSIQKLRQTKAHLESDILKIEKTLHLDPTDLEISKTKKQELTENASKLQKEINQTLNNISEKNKELSQNRIEKQTLKNKISDLRDPALLAELATFEEKRNEINEETARLSGEIKNIDVQINTIYLKEKEKIQEILKQISKEQDEFKTEIEYIQKEAKEKQEELNKKESVAKDFHSKFKALFEKRSQIDNEITKNETTVSNRIDDSRKVEIRQNTLTLKHAEIASELAGIQQEFSQYEGVEILTNRTEDQLKYEINKFEKMKSEIGSVNMRALEIYDNVEKEYSSLLEKKDVLVREKDDVVNMMEEIEEKKTDLFMKQYQAVNENFKSIFSQLTTKGEANLELENQKNPFEGGLGVKVRLTGHKFLDIRSLSGGEKTLTALAFIFAIQEHEPASFYILDEVDAALDKRNSEKLSKLIAKYAERAQYVLISHNDGVISAAQNLYGISMDEHGISKVVSLKV